MDSLFITMEKLESTREIIESTNQFYRNSFSDLLVVFGILFAVVGIIIPLVFFLIQRNDLNKLEKETEKNINVKVNDAKGTIEKSLLAKTDEYLSKLNERFNELSIDLDNKGKAIEESLAKKYDKIIQDKISELRSEVAETTNGILEDIYQIYAMNSDEPHIMIIHYALSIRYGLETDSQTFVIITLDRLIDALMRGGWDDSSSEPKMLEVVTQTIFELKEHNKDNKFDSYIQKLEKLEKSLREKSS